jgi:opacity protein-like surface antigen
MKIQLLSGIALSMLALAAVPAQADDITVKPYVSVFGGASFLNSVDTGGAPGSFYDVKTNTGYLIGGAVGLKWNDLLRTELELSHGSNNANSYAVNGGAFLPASGPISATYLLGNVWLDIPTQSSFTPYIGGGLGVGWATADVFFQGSPAYGPNASGGAFAYQVGGGVKYTLSPKIDLDIGYRYKSLGKTDFTNRFLAGLYSGAILTSHNVQVGLTFNF